MLNFTRKALMAITLTTLAYAPTACRATEWHVATAGRDTNRGTKSAPLRTIQRAANLAQPGDTITVHAGVYRERISPPRGGASEQKRIVYRAAPGEKVTITGAEAVRGWQHVQRDVWKVSIDNKLFGAFNPYRDLIHGDWFDRRGRDHHTGAVYQNGQWLIEAANLKDLMLEPGRTPDWLAQAGQQYLLNIAWIRPAGAPTRIAADSFGAKLGTQNAPCSEGGQCVGYISHGNWVRYDGVDLGNRASTLTIRTASEADGGVIEIHDGSPQDALLGSCSTGNTSGWQSWVNVTAHLKPVAGRHNLCLVFKSLPNSALNAGLWYAQVDSKSTTIWAQFRTNPNRTLTEVNVRRTVFYPQRTGINYITVRGFTLCKAATPWAPPTAEQIGVVGPHWSRGWIIENNTVTHSTCSGISLGKYGDQYDNTSADTAEGYVLTIQRALNNGWNRDTVGGHIVRNNAVAYCEQAGIVGSLGAVFSTVTGNTIHDIHVRRLFSGAEMAGIKFHAAIDVTIRGNHIYRTSLGTWLDWMAQGTRVSRNLMHDNGQDLFMEVDHGPYLVDNNLFLSPSNLHSRSQGGAYVHNLFCGGIMSISLDERLTPYHRPHSTQLAGMHNNPNGDDRYINNVFVKAPDLSQYDNAALPMLMEGNVYLAGAKPSVHDRSATVLPTNPNIKLVVTPKGVYLEANLSALIQACSGCQPVTSDTLGTSVIAKQAYEQTDGSRIAINADYCGAVRSASRTTPGPFATVSGGLSRRKVW